MGDKRVYGVAVGELLPSAFYEIRVSYPASQPGKRHGWRMVNAYYYCHYMSAYDNDDHNHDDDDDICNYSILYTLTMSELEDCCIYCYDHSSISILLLLLLLLLLNSI